MKGILCSSFENYSLQSCTTTLFQNDMGVNEPNSNEKGLI